MRIGHNAPEPVVSRRVNNRDHNMPFHSTPSMGVCGRTGRGKPTEFESRQLISMRKSIIESNSQANTHKRPLFLGGDEEENSIAVNWSVPHLASPNGKTYISIKLISCLGFIASRMANGKRKTRHLILGTPPQPNPHFISIYDCSTKAVCVKVRRDQGGGLMRCR